MGFSQHGSTVGKLWAGSTTVAGTTTKAWASQDSLKSILGQCADFNEIYSLHQVDYKFAGLFEDDMLMIYTLARGSWSPSSHFVIFIPEMKKIFSKISNQDPNLLQSYQLGGCSGTELHNFWRRCLEAWYLFELLHDQVDLGKGALEVGDKLSHLSAGQIWKKEIRHLLVGFLTDENLDVTSKRVHETNTCFSLFTFSLWPSGSPYHCFTDSSDDSGQSGCCGWIPSCRDGCKVSRKRSQHGKQGLKGCLHTGREVGVCQ